MNRKVKLREWCSKYAHRLLKAIYEVHHTDTKTDTLTHYTEYRKTSIGCRFLSASQGRNLHSAVASRCPFLLPEYEKLKRKMQVKTSKSSKNIKINKIMLKNKSNT